MRMPPGSTPTAAAHRRLRQRQSLGRGAALKASALADKSADAEPAVDQENETSAMPAAKEVGAETPTDEALVPSAVLGESTSHVTTTSNHNDGGVDSFVAALKKAKQLEAAPPGAYRRLNAKVKKLEVKDDENEEKPVDVEEVVDAPTEENRGGADAVKTSSLAHRRRAQRAAIFKAGKHPKPSVVNEVVDRRSSDENSVVLMERDRLGSDEEIAHAKPKSRRSKGGKWTSAVKSQGDDREDESSNKEDEHNNEKEEIATEANEEEPPSKPSLNRWKMQEDQLHLARLRRAHHATKDNVSDAPADDKENDGTLTSGKGKMWTPRSKALDVWKNAGAKGETAAVEQREADAAEEASPFACRRKAFAEDAHTLEASVSEDDGPRGTEEDAKENAEAELAAKENSHLRQFQRRRHLLERRWQAHAGQTEKAAKETSSLVGKKLAVEPIEGTDANAKDEKLNEIQRKRQLFQRRLKAHEDASERAKEVAANAETFIGDICDASEGRSSDDSLPKEVAEQEAEGYPEPLSNKGLAGEELARALLAKLESKITSQTESLQESAQLEESSFATFEPEWAVAPTGSGDDARAFESVQGGEDGTTDFFQASAFDEGAFGGGEAGAFEQGIEHGESNAFKQEFGDICEDEVLVTSNEEARDMDAAFAEEVDFDFQPTSTLPVLPEEGPAFEGDDLRQEEDGLMVMENSGEYGEELPTVPEESDEGLDSTTEAFQAGLDDEQLAAFYEIMAAHESKVLQLEESNKSKADEVEFLKGEMMGQHDQILGLLEGKTDEAEGDAVAALNEEIADLRLQLVAAQQKGRKGTKKMKGLRLGSMLKFPGMSR